MAYKDIYLNESGHLPVGDGHKIYWEDWGNPKATPTFMLHGGPGGGFNDSHKWIFDPEKHRVILHDQRGCGHSTPFASLKNNTTQDLISDIEKLREHLGIKKMHVVGGSWGSTLSLLYAIEHPQRVLKLMMWGIYLLRQFENDWLYEGGPRMIYPEAWQRFISFVPEDYRGSGNKVIKFYYDKLNDESQAVAEKYAIEWALWEMNLLSLRHEPKKLEKEISEDKNALALSRLEAHYFVNKCFVPENYILDNIVNSKHIPAYVVQGRFDMCTPPISAFDLKEAYGENMTLQIVNGGHLRHEPEVISALKATANTFLK